MGSTPVCYIDETGIHVPEFPTIWNYFQDAFRTIYGSDVYLGNDGQDGQWLGILAAAINDANQMAVQVYNSFAPSTAVGAGLASVVKVNGIKKKVPSRSQVDVIVVGQAGTEITNGIVQDVRGVQWVLPTYILIPQSGQVEVTAICAQLGAITVPKGSVEFISNPQLGWQSVTNLVDADVGLPVESDAQLRLRQSKSTEIPSLGLLEGLAGALWSLNGVRTVAVYENDTNIPDANGIPGHCYSVVIDGGNVNDIATVINVKKGGGVGTYGDNIFRLVDKFGVPHDIAFFRPKRIQVTWKVFLDTFPGYTANTEAAIAKALADWTNNLGTGTNVREKRAYVPANLNGGAGSETFDLLDLQVARDGYNPTDADVPIAFNEQPYCITDWVQFLYPDAH